MRMCPSSAGRKSGAREFGDELAGYTLVNAVHGNVILKAGPLDERPVTCGARRRLLR